MPPIGTGIPADELGGMRQRQDKRGVVRVTGRIASDGDQGPLLPLSGSTNNGHHPSGGTRQLGLLATQYLAERHPILSPQKRYPLEVRRYFMVHIIPSLGAQTSVRSITRVDIKNLLMRYDDQPALRRNIYTTISGFYLWLYQEEYILDNVLKRVNPPPLVAPRERTLREHELKALGKALAGESYPFGPYILFLLLTAQRRSEAALMRWDELDGDNWVIPKTRTKNRRTHILPLPPTVISLLASLPRTSPYPFQALSGFSKRLTKLKARMPSDARDWTLHDLRRTGATIMGKEGIPPHVIEKVLNHSPGRLQETYQRYEYLEEKREALKALSRGILRNF